jgi:ADP-heptose:LPS heptosyltransferase
MILSTGVMRAIARSHPTITLDVLASPANAAILDAADYVGQVIVFDKRRLRSYLPTALRLRRARYDAVIDCMVTAPSVTTLLLIAASGARHRVGIAGRGNDSAFTVLVPPDDRPAAHMVDLLAALAPAFGPSLADEDRNPTLVVTDEEHAAAEAEWGARDGPRVLVNVSAGTIARRWPPERYAAVMHHIATREPSAEFLVVGAPAESDRAMQVAHTGGGRYIATRTLREVLALVATSDFVFTPDTSIAHAASAFRKPAVAMYVRGTAERWGLRGSVFENVEHRDRTLDDLSVEDVLPAVDRVWNRARPRWVG